MIWDRVAGTDKVSLDDQRIENGLVQAKVRFVCQKRQFAVTNEYFTPYDPSQEIYEVPVGLVTLPFTLLWYLGCEAVSLATAPIEAAAGPLHWSAAGLNPLLNVENGMFAERYSIKEKPGSRRPQEGSTPEPYDAVLPPDSGQIKAWFDGGGVITLTVGEELLLTINLVEVARVMPAASAQKILIEVLLRWNPEAEPVAKQIPVFIDQDLAGKLYGIRDYSHMLMTTTDRITFDKAAEEINKQGFSRETAMIRDKRKNELLEPVQTAPVK
ncbi:MAG: hypothetical protein KJ645_05710 [Planctomycetes bacterium]|nr:hypothetical protein [Planctomycetota bacterium]